MSKIMGTVQLFATPWSVAYQAPPSMGFSRQEYWRGLPFPSPGDLRNSEIEPRSLTFQADALTSEPPGKPAGVQPQQDPGGTLRMNGVGERERERERGDVRPALIGPSL